MLSDFCCSMTCLKWLRLLNEPFKKSCVVFILWKHLFGFLLWCFIWVDLAYAYNMFDSYKVAINLYDHLVFDFWCHCMLLLMLLCRFAWLWPLLLSLLAAPSLLLALVLYWVWALLVHPTPKNQVMPMCPPYIPISNLLFQVHLTCFYLSLELNSYQCYVKISQ
jgi:hypothetical protein